MRKIYCIGLCSMMFILSSCSLEEPEDTVATTFFTTTYKNTGFDCNTTSLNFIFLVTRISDGSQESYTVPKGEIVTGSLIGFDDGNTLNVKVFADSSPNGLHEANIPIILNNYTEEQLRSSNNKLDISYCRETDIGNITWVYNI